MKRTLLTLLIALHLPILAWSKTLMIDPAGHAKQTGRQLFQSYERAETFKCAEAIKLALEQQMSNIRVVLSRAPGDEIIPLQNASFANRLGVDLFLRLQFFKDTAEKPKMYVYYLSYDPLMDATGHKAKPFAFTPINQAHQANMATSINCAQKCIDLFSGNEYQSTVECVGMFGLPIKPLLGITAPAITIECGLRSDDQWTALVQPLITFVENILKD